MSNRTAVIETNHGTIKFELLEEDAPKTTENFRIHAGNGYYDGVIFHRIIPNFYAESEHITADTLVERLLEAVPRPRSGM